MFNAATGAMEARAGIMTSLKSVVESFERNHPGLELRSAEDFAQRFEQFHGSYSVRLTSKTDPNSSARLTTAAFGDMRLAVTRWNAGIEGTVTSDQEHFCLRLPLSGTAETLDPHCGMFTSGPDDIGLFRARQGIKLVSSPDNAALNFAIPAALLEDRSKSYHGEELTAPLVFPSRIEASSRPGIALTNLVNYVLAQLISFPQVFDNQLMLANFREHVVSTVLGLVPHNTGRPDLAAPCAIPGSVKRAEDFMRANANTPIKLQTLANEAGCSERALQNAFKEFRCKSPMSVLRDIRLEKAREDLECEAGSVSDIALKWGFANIGRFAAQYAAMFGEMPSQTRQFG